MRVLINSGRTVVFLTARKRLVEDMISNGHEVYVSGFQSEYSDKLSELGVKFIHIPFSRAGLNPIEAIRLIHTYKSIVLDNQIEVVHSYTIKPNIFGSIGAWLAGCKQIFPVVNGLGYAFTSVGGAKKRCLRCLICCLYKIAFKNAKNVFFQNSDDALELQNRGIVKEPQICIVAGSGIDLNEFPYEPNKEEMTFFMATRLLRTKGTEYYLEAAKKVKIRFPNAQFYLAGNIDKNPDGITEDELKKYIDSGVVNYLGVISNMPEVLRKMSVFVLPSYYREGVPHAILEAMSSGCAIITTDWIGCKETVIEGINGYLAKVKDIDSLVLCIEKMITNQSSVYSMGKESRRLAEEIFDVEIVNGVMLKKMELL